MTESSKKHHTYACPSCRARLEFDPSEGKLECPYCGRKEVIPNNPQEVKENSYGEYLQAAPAVLAQLSEGALEVACSQCRAQVSFIPPEVATKCPFCGLAIVIEARAANPVVAPQGVLPFKIPKRKAAELVRGWLQSRWFAPNALKRFALQGEIAGVYLPYWTYDAHTTTPYHGSRGEHYYTQETYTTTDSSGNRVTRTRSVRHTRWYSVSGTVQYFFDDVLAPATTSVSRTYLNQLEPWDLTAVASYDSAYLAGYKAQRYQLDMKEGFAEAREVMECFVKELVCKDIGGDEQRIDSMATHYSAITFKHLLLPVYIGAYCFRSKVYQVLVNATSGEVQGERPYSVGKIVSAVLVVVVIGFIILSYANR